MGLLNLYKVTKTLIDLLSQNITKNIDTSLVGSLNVTAIPPEKVENPTNTLSLHLYHVAEDPFYKNALGPGNDAPNVAKAPMALSLFYILTAHHESNSEFDAETQQKLMGYALKTFHDFPVITSRTRINGSPILDQEFGDDVIQTILRPVTPEEAISFWNTQESNTARLSSYYEVRVVMLRPEPPRTMPGIVLNLGAFVIQLGSAHLERSQSLVRFKIPEKNGGTIQEIEATPARVTLDTSATPPAAHNRLLLFGANITRGRSRSLFLRNSIWAKLAPPDGPIEESVVDLGQNPDWSVDFQTDRVTVKLAPALRHIKPDGASVDLPALPGFYTALVRSVMDEQVINNELKRITVSSNEVSFAVSPRIQGHDAPDADGNIQINLGPEFDPLDPNLPEAAIQVVVAGEVYTRVNAEPLTNAKEFFVANSPSNLIRIRPHFPVAVTQPEAHPALLIVNGAESAPFWIELNP
jgi:Pvc16 N-terminal domain